MFVESFGIFPTELVFVWLQNYSKSENKNESTFSFLEKTKGIFLVIFMFTGRIFYYYYYDHCQVWQQTADPGQDFICCVLAVLVQDDVTLNQYDVVQADY